MLKPAALLSSKQQAHTPGQVAVYRVKAHICGTLPLRSCRHAKTDPSRKP